MAEEAKDITVGDVFGDAAPQEGAQEASEATQDGHEASLGTGEPQEAEQVQEAAGAPQGRPDYVPEKFWRASKEDPKKGEVNLEAWGKSTRDAATYMKRIEGELKELRAGKGGKAPKDVSEYAMGFDLPALKRLAPNAFGSEEAETLDEAGEKPTIDAFFAAAHKVGLPTDAARTMLGQFYAGLDEYIDPPVSDDDRLKSAIAGQGPNGQRIAQDVRGYVSGLAGSLSQGEMAVVHQMVRSPSGLSLLWTLSRQGVATAPPDGLNGAGAEVMSEDELDKAFTSDRYYTDEGYRSRIDRAYRRSRGKETPEFLSGTIERSLV